MSKLQKFLQDRRMTHFEGVNGLKNLCRLVKVLGYKDSQHFGQFEAGCSYGILLNFLEDNSGACDAIVEFIEEYMCEEWEENLSRELSDEEHEDEH